MQKYEKMTFPIKINNSASRKQEQEKHFKSFTEGYRRFFLGLLKKKSNGSTYPENEENLWKCENIAITTYKLFWGVPFLTLHRIT